jgi:hypothetical protein
VAKKWLIISFVLQMLIVAYWEVTEYVDLFPFNDVATTENSFEASLANDVPKVCILIILWIGMRWLTSPTYLFLYFSSIVYYIVFLSLQIIEWWPRYIFGASPEELQDYHKKFGKTIKILPSWDNHLAVDLQHNILQTLTLTIIIVMIITLAKLWKARKLELAAAAAGNQTAANAEAVKAEEKKDAAEAVVEAEAKTEENNKTAADN